jgi:hypothetical protein
VMFRGGLAISSGLSDSIFSIDHSCESLKLFPPESLTTFVSAEIV